ncbi:MAG: hypothetical protein K9G49_06750 [Taibaiella sp.]|nr:hypothetical protein [Taibaiella sp.]
MTKQASIAYISGLMDTPATLSDGDQSSIAGFRQSFPYFVPARYLEAFGKHRQEPFSPAMLSASAPYMGDWILFCDFMQSGVVVQENAALAPVTAEVNKVVDVVSEPEVVVGDPVLTNILYEEAAVEAVTIPVLPVISDAITETAIDIEVPDIETVVPVIEKKPANFWTQEDDSEEETNQEVELATGPEVEHMDIEEVVADPEIIPQPEVLDVEEIIEPIPVKAPKEEKPLISPVYTSDYFLQQGEKIPNEFPDEIESLKPDEHPDEAAKALMVMMSFSEWLMHFKSNTEKQKEETKDQRALKTMWQKEKLAAAIEEENEEIPENVFEMAVNSITKEDGLASESLAEIYIKQGKFDKSIDMYRKLSLRNPQKSAYFARKIEEILKEKQS